MPDILLSQFLGAVSGAKKRCLLEVNSNISLTTGANTSIGWSAAVYQDGHAFWAIGSPDQIDIPSDASAVRITAQCRFASNGSLGVRNLYLSLNGSTAFAGRTYNQLPAAAATDIGLTIATPVIPLTPGINVFRVFALQDSGASLDIVGLSAGISHTYVCVEVID